MAQKHSSVEAPGPQSEAAGQYWPHVVKLCEAAGGFASVMIHVTFDGARGIGPRIFVGQVAGQNRFPSGPQVPASGISERRFEGG